MSASARRTSVLISSTESGWNSNTRLRLTSASFTAKNGLAVVMPTRITTPSSTSGNSASCWALLKRWISSIIEQRRPAAGGHLVAGLVQNLADVLHAAGDGAELAEAAVGFLGQQAGERRLAGARRAVEDHRAQPLGLQHPPQQLAFAEEVLLADELGERRRPHPRGQRLHLLRGSPLRFEQTDRPSDQCSKRFDDAARGQQVDQRARFALRRRLAAVILAHAHQQRMILIVERGVGGQARSRSNP